MEPLDLTCLKCNATWKVIKAEGAIACPYCKAIVDLPTIPSSSAATVPATVPSEMPATADKPAETTATNEASPLIPATVPVAPINPIPSLASQARQFVDDPSVQADYDDRHDARRRGGMHPLLKVFMILLILFVLLPVALIILGLVVCAVMLAGR